MEYDCCRIGPAGSPVSSFPHLHQFMYSLISECCRRGPEHQIPVSSGPWGPPLRSSASHTCIIWSLRATAAARSTIYLYHLVSECCRCGPGHHIPVWCDLWGLPLWSGAPYTCIIRSLSAAAADRGGHHIPVWCDLWRQPLWSGAPYTCIIWSLSAAAAVRRPTRLAGFVSLGSELGSATIRA